MCLVKQGSNRDLHVFSRWLLFPWAGIDALRHVRIKRRVFHVTESIFSEDRACVKTRLSCPLPRSTSSSSFTLTERVQH